MISIAKANLHDRWQSVPMRKRAPNERSHDCNEVAIGYTEEEAVEEASRCLLCSAPQCVKGCPVEVDIPAFVRLIRQKRYGEAARKIKEKNSLPAVCGRVCPQEKQCQRSCYLGKKGDPLAIGHLERFVADFEREKGVEVPRNADPTGKQVAVVGAGPAGLTVAAQLAKLGHKVTIFEALHAAGGVLVYGIPEFRLPKKIVKQEIDYIKKLGVCLHTDAPIGRLFTIEEILKNGFQAVFIGTGAGLPQFLGIPGENLTGIYSANEFLIRANLMRSPWFDTPIKVGKRVAVIGGGNVAVDSARTALRLGAESVSMVYRRSREEMPAREEEIINAEEEGIKFHFLVSPTRFLGDDQGQVKAIEYNFAELGEPDESGRRRPVLIQGLKGILDVDTVIVAIGRTPNSLIQNTTKGLETTKNGLVLIDDATGQTSLKAVYAGGDVATGEATVISAMGAGRKAANNIHEYLTADNRPSLIPSSLQTSSKSDYCSRRKKQITEIHKHKSNLNDKKC